MQTSENINELATALAKAQGHMGGALKDSANPFFKSRYADLESVWNACRKSLSEHGLAVVQTTATTENNAPAITTMLTHCSGQWIRDTLTLFPKDSSPQGMGSAITYGRRYALAAIVGVYQTDDDGEAAQSRGKINPRGDDFKKEDQDKAAAMAGKFREALKVGIDQAVYDLHLQCVDDSTFYIAVSTHLTPGEHKEIKQIVDRARQAAPKILPNGRAAAAAR